MIRINLLAGERRAAKAAAPGFQAGQKITVIGSLILVLTAGRASAGATGRSASRRPQLDARHRGGARAKKRASPEILKQVARVRSAQARCCEARVALIDELRKGQTAPVHMIDQISRALPEMTWLTSVKQDGYDVTIQGRCLTLTSLSDFVGNLEASRYFKRPVEIVESAVVPGDGKTARPDPVHHPRHVPDGRHRIGGAAAAGPTGKKGGKRG